MFPITPSFPIPPHHVRIDVAGKGAAPAEVPSTNVDGNDDAYATMHNQDGPASDTGIESTMEAPDKS